MIVKKLRLQRGWSQSHLAECSALSLRTIQRIEQGQAPSLESAKSLAAVFAVDVNDIRQVEDMNEASVKAELASEMTVSKQEKEAFKHVHRLKRFYQNLLSYLCVMALLLVINLITSPGYLWVVWPALGWGIGVLIDGVSVFGKLRFLGPEWEKRQVEKHLGRKL